MSLKNIQGKLRRIKQTVYKATEPTPEEVGRAMMYHGEHGEFPGWASARVRELCGAIIEWGDKVDKLVMEVG